jgi:rod shape-determining protein MreC
MLDFLRRNRIGLTSGFLLLLSLVLLTSGARSGHRNDPLGRTVLEVLRPLQGAVASGWNRLTGVWTGYVALVSVREENERLKKRVFELEQQALRIDEILETDRRLAELLRFRASLIGDAQAAMIIGRDPFPSFGTVTISKGEADGVRKGMAVLSAAGVVGRIMSTSPNSSRVLLITDHNSGVDALVQRTRARGIVEGSLDGRCVMKYLKREEDVEVGDRIITSGLDGIFPKGIQIGEVTHLNRGTRGLMQVAEVHPSVALDRIEEVLVVSGQATFKTGSNEVAAGNAVR